MWLRHRARNYAISPDIGARATRRQISTIVTACYRIIGENVCACMNTFNGFDLTAYRISSPLRREHVEKIVHRPRRVFFFFYLNYFRSTATWWMASRVFGERRVNCAAVNQYEFSYRIRRKLTMRERHYLEFSLVHITIGTYMYVTLRSNATAFFSLCRRRWFNC